ncbi:DUF445 domain-containing protein [Anaeroselena agilis]|uniref:DUF445 domain-containing protein n=1 Tax=Anaeroselena agilis TaxID=3063788 RepID=A0ABU3P4A1_9FIRM|nr:DUF445 domain-containing protein [Selenomonadales bacterium 4137-cl]
MVAVGAAAYRRKANRVLAFVFALFAAAAAAKYRYPDSLGVRIAFIVAEAALVGGIADWFAVTALFRRPLGFPWHTALIPKSRDKIVAAIAGAVQNELLSKESIKNRLAGVRLVDVIVGWLEEGDRQALLPSLAARYAQSAWAGLDIPAVARYGQKWLKALIHEADLAAHSRQGLAWLLASGRADRITEQLLAEITAAAARDSTRLAIERHLDQYSRTAARSWWQKLVLSLAEATDTLNTAEAAAVLHAELLHLLRDLAAADHPVRAWVRTRLAAAAERLDGDPAWAAGLDTWRKGLAGRLRLEESLAALAALAVRNAPSDWPSAWAARQAEKLWAAFKADSAMRDWVEEQLQAALNRFIDSEHGLVATVVKDALIRLSDEDLNTFIEDKAGEDLAWIRINGSVVGGVVGLLLFLFLHYLYDPYIVPMFHAVLR